MHMCFLRGFYAHVCFKRVYAHVVVVFIKFYARVCFKRVLCTCVF